MKMTRVDSQGFRCSGVDEFNRLTVNILASLYDIFPKIAILGVNNFYEEVDDEGLANLDGTMTFLKDEGFVKFSSSAGDGQIFIGVQLTGKALDLLEKVPNSLEKGLTIGDKVKAAIKLGTKEGFKEVVKTIIGEAIKS